MKIKSRHAHLTGPRKRKRIGGKKVKKTKKELFQGIPPEDRLHIRAVRLKDAHVQFCEDIVMLEQLLYPDSNINVSAVIRHAIEELMKDYSEIVDENRL